MGLNIIAPDAQFDNDADALKFIEK